VNQSSETGSDSPHPTPMLLAIYRELRVGMVMVMVMLAAAVVVERILVTDWQSALSAYYYTTAHSIFIAALLALSTLFFVYKGRSDTEDALLTLAGVCTFTAALVPQGRPVGRYDVIEYNPEPAILPNVVAIVVALVLGWVLIRLQRRRNRSPNTRRSLGGTLSLYLLRLVVAVGLITLAVPPLLPLFYEHAHGAAGTLMIFSFIATVFCTAYVVGQQKDHRYRTFYRVIAVGMLVTLIAVVTAHLVRPNLLGGLFVIVLESVLILEFAAYWVVQTVELWDSPEPREQLSDGARRRPAEGRGLTRLRNELAQARQELAQARKMPSGQRLLPLL
jgi:hypothetical protein